MTRIIKDLNTFSEETSLNEDFSWGNLLSGALDFAGEGVRKTIKEKIAASIMETFGIMENSLLSAFVQEIVEKIPVKDYPGIIMGEKANVDYLAPIMVEAMDEFIERKGFDALAEQLGIEPNGWLYRIIVNGIQSPSGKEKLKQMFVEAFGGKDATGSVARDAISSLPVKDKKLISDNVKKKLSSYYGKSVEMEPDKSKGFGDYVSDFWHSLIGDKEPQKSL
jgi:hypothetical protein